ncbi:unnamed protein product [Knipowitschia caucasica]
MPTEGPSTRQKERKDPDQTSGNLVLEIRALTATIDALKLSFEQQLDSKVDSLRDSVQLMMSENKMWLKEELFLKAAEIQTNIQQNMDNDISLLIRRIEQMEAKINRSEKTRFDPDVSIVVTGLNYNSGENVTCLVKELLTEGLLENTPIVDAERLKDRGGRPGVVKVEFGSVQEKISVLRKKQLLKDNPKYSRVYIRSGKTHAERLIELNFRTLLDELPFGRQFYVAGNGKIRRRPGSGAGAEASIGAGAGTSGGNSGAMRRTAT